MRCPTHMMNTTPGMQNLWPGCLLYVRWRGARTTLQRHSHARRGRRPSHSREKELVAAGIDEALPGTAYRGKCVQEGDRRGASYPPKPAKTRWPRSRDSDPAESLALSDIVDSDVAILGDWRQGLQFAPNFKPGAAQTLTENDAFAEARESLLAFPTQKFRRDLFGRGRDTARSNHGRIWILRGGITRETKNRSWQQVTLSKWFHLLTQATFTAKFGPRVHIGKRWSDGPGVVPASGVPYPPVLILRALGADIR